MLRLLATAGIPHAAHALLEEIGIVEVSRGDLRSEVAAADVLLVRGERVDGDCIRAGERLRVIARTGAGVDNVDLDAATAAGIPVVNAPDVGAQPMAEGTWALIIAAAKRLGELRACFAPDGWDERYAIQGLDLDGATLGIVGLGAIGREVGRIGRAFGMHVVAYDPGLPDGPSRPDGVELVGLEELLARVDVVTLHCPLTEATRGLIDRAALGGTRGAPVLVNAARGEVVDGDRLLLEALDRGWLSAVGLDVFASEPLASSSPLLRDPRVICTPHAIGLTRRWNERVFAALRNDIGSVLAGERPANLVNPDVLAGLS
ncbi:MAG: oxidoreductase [Conexibacter sp.]|nr:oxidoreductase [Conexibacter sp.]